MFGGSAYLFAIVQYFSFAFFPFIPFATQLFSTPVMSSKLRYLRSSAFFRAPLITAIVWVWYWERWKLFLEELTCLELMVVCVVINKTACSQSMINYVLKSQTCTKCFIVHCKCVGYVVYYHLGSLHVNEHQ